MSYYLPRYNFAVRLQGGQYVLVCRSSRDQLATAPEQVAAIEGWAARNRAKYRSLQ